MRHLAKFKKLFLIISLIGSISLFGASILMAICGVPNYLKWLNSSALLLSLAGLIQLEITGLFERIFEFYANEEKFPYGPPSHFTRDLFEIQDPDKPFRTWLWISLFQERNTGFWILIISVLIQLVATVLS